MAKRGRPDLYSPEIAKAICDRLASGESLRSICRSDGFPEAPTVRLWVLENRGGNFAEQYACARNNGYEVMAEEIIELSDLCREGVKVKTFPDGRVETVTGDMVDRARLQVDARKWILSKMRPERYGDKTTIAGDSQNPLTIKVHRISGTDENPE